MFKFFRVTVLLSVLVFVALSAYTLDSSLRDWEHSKWVVIYPINGDGSAASERYISRLNDDAFTSLQRFLNREAARYALPKRDPFRVRLGPAVTEQPPVAPESGSWLAVVWWSLTLRYWAADFNESDDGPPADIKIFVEYYDPAAYHILPHSVGVKKLSLAVVKAFADRDSRGSNKVVIAHELMHLFGATDKYDPVNSLPLFPDGYAEPNKQPRYPQTKAELMGGRIPISASKAEIPGGFSQVVVGNKTAAEVGWSN
ncbi:MAG: hypothetical protein GXP10_06670 [Gammaproteobacteria bacterium]|nr:hypothetical protein [Gammaproteobacteria bacterium]